MTLFPGLRLQPPNINPLEVVLVPKKDYCLHSQEVQMHQTRLKTKMNQKVIFESFICIILRFHEILPRNRRNLVKSQEVIMHQGRLKMKMNQKVIFNSLNSLAFSRDFFTNKSSKLKNNLMKSQLSTHLSQNQRLILNFMPLRFHDIFARNGFLKIEEIS